MCIMGIPEGEERMKTTEEIPETIMTKNFPKLMPDNKQHIQEAQKENKTYTQAYDFQITGEQR